MKHRSQRQGSPKQFRAVKTSPHLHVAHPKHTGHVLSHRTTSYPTLAMVVLCVGVFLISWTHFVTADPFVYPGPVTNSYTVHASVPGPPPSQPANLDSPVNASKFTTSPITVSGSCPQNTYETLYRNSVFSGVALCDATGSYQLQTDLFVGTNQLQVRDFSLTDVPGPMSNVVSVIYTPPIPPPTAGPGANSSSGNATSALGNSAGASVNSPAAQAEPLIFKTNFTYQGQDIGAAASWQVDIEGGTAPYAISVDWGDGSHSLISQTQAGTFTIDHTYKKTGAYKGSYVVKFSASDANGAQAFLQLLGIVNNSPNAAGSTRYKPPIGSFSSNTPAYLNGLMKYVWPGYGIVVLMLASFWLGEQREYHYLPKPRFKRPKRA
jgi:hypothetical protein